jgi:predicted transposase/invertase (TIGR01784 family)
MKQRSVYFMSKMVTEQMAAGRNHSDIKRSVCIIITNYTFVPENDCYHNQFRYRTEDGVEFTNLTEFNTLELNKLPSDADSTDLWYWMKFIKADKEEDLDMLAQRSPQMRKAVGVLKELSADERTRMLYEEREIARRDIVSLMGGAKREGITEVARNLLNVGDSIDKIIAVTGLTRDEVEGLRGTN